MPRARAGRAHWILAVAGCAALSATDASADDGAPPLAANAVPPALAPDAGADSVVLDTGETLRGRVLSRTEVEVVLDHPVLGMLTIPSARVKQASNAAGAPFAIAPPAPPPPPPPAPAPPPPEWKFQGEVGVNGTEGTVDNQDLHAAIQALLETPEHRWKFTAGYQRTETEEVKTKELGHVDGLKDFLYPGSPWFWFLTARMDWDDFQPWDSRFSGGAGVGYTAYDKETFKLRFRAGLNYVREFNVSETLFPDHDDSRVEALVGAETEWKINKAQQLEAKATYYPDLSDSGEYRLVASLAWSINLNESGSLAFKLGLEDEYDTHREDPIEKNEFRYFAALLFRF